MGFQHHTEAIRFLAELKARLNQFGLALHPEKTRLIEFGRFAADNRRKRGEDKPETFDFLGFTHMCAKTRNRGWFLVRRKTVKKRLRAALKRIKTALRGRMHDPISEVGDWLRRVVLGYYRYHAVPGNCEAMRTFREDLIRNWYKVLRRRGQKRRIPPLRQACRLRGKRVFPVLVDAMITFFAGTSPETAWIHEVKS